MLVTGGCAVDAGDGSIGSSNDALGTPANLPTALRAIARDNGHEGFPRLDRDVNAAEEEILRKRARLGQFLFYDRALSGVEQTSCATCHHAGFMYTDARNIARGVFCEMNADGSQTFCSDPPAPADGDLVGPARTAPLNFRNTPSAVNAALFPRQMINGRVHFVDDSSTDVNALDPTLGFDTQLPDGILFTRSLLGAQAFKPVPDAFEMAGDWPDVGQPFDSEPSRTFRIQEGLAARIDAIAEYRQLFEEAYGAAILPGDPTLAAGEPLEYEHIGDAVAQFQEHFLVLTDSPWDHFLTGDDTAMSDSAQRGAWIFFTSGQCASCHSGEMFSDFENHNIGVPQIGPGTVQSDPDPAYAGLTTWDFGGEELTGERADRFSFRTPPLRGAALSAPYMHNGAYATLEDAIRHHVNPREAYATYDMDAQGVEQDMQDAEGLKPPEPVFDAQNPVVVGPGTEHEIPPLSDRDIADLVEFLRALTDPRMRNLVHLVPNRVPSGLPMDVLGPAEFPVY